MVALNRSFAFVLACLLGVYLLGRMEGKHFRQAVIALMALTGCILLWQERATLLGWFGSAEGMRWLWDHPPVRTLALTIAESDHNSRSVTSR